MTAERKQQLREELKAIADLASLAANEEQPQDLSEREYWCAVTARLQYVRVNAARTIERIRDYHTGMVNLPWPLREGYARRDVLSVDVVKVNAHYVVKWQTPKGKERCDTWTRRPKQPSLWDLKSV